jgi:hypothetical protein
MPKHPVPGDPDFEYGDDRYLFNGQASVSELEEVIQAIEDHDIPNLDLQRGSKMMEMRAKMRGFSTAEEFIASRKGSLLERVEKLRDQIKKQVD